MRPSFPRCERGTRASTKRGNRYQICRASQRRTISYYLTVITTKLDSWKQLGSPLRARTPKIGRYIFPLFMLLDKASRHLLCRGHDRQPCPLVPLYCTVYKYSILGCLVGRSAYYGRKYSHTRSRQRKMVEVFWKMLKRCRGES